MSEKGYLKKIKIGKEDKKDKIKLIQTNKFKNHIEAHKQDFNISYYKLISFIERNEYLDKCDEDFIEKVIELPFEVGYTHLSETGEEDFIIYAKRLNRDIYSKFTLNRSKRVTNKCVVVLRKNKNADNEYFIVTMFPGEYAVKELEDRNIKTEDERERVVKFWDKHAFAYDVNIINPATIIDQDSYRKIYGQG
ncbi:MAG: hypothetical protein ACRCW0_08175 [Clostridium sp.]